MITLTSWQPHGRCRWCERNGGCPTADFGAGYLRDVPLCLDCLTDAARMRLHEESGECPDADRNNECVPFGTSSQIVHFVPEVTDVSLRHLGLSEHPAGPKLRPQPMHTDGTHPRCFFQPAEDKPLIATAAAIAMYGATAILDCLQKLQREAEQQRGLDEVQVFEDPGKPEALWFIDQHDDIVALLPSDF